MTRIPLSSLIWRCEVYISRFCENKEGRDFIVPDVHGRLDRLKALFASVDFDSSRDRVFCVGDLIDWGPQSYEMLLFAMENEAWFHTVIGNHEDMLLCFAGVRDSDYHSAMDFIRNGGEWVLELDDERKKDLLGRILPWLDKQPYVICVDGQNPFSVIHAEVGTVTDHLDFLFDEKWVQEHIVELTWDRKVCDSHRHHYQDVLKHLYVPKASNRRVIYSGHTIVPFPLQVGNCVFLDCGAKKDGARLHLHEHPVR